MSDLQKSILSTIIYYDVLDMAPTSHEVWSNLLDWKGQTPYLGEVLQALADLKQQGLIGQKWGFNSLTGKEHLAVERLDKLNFVDEKWKKAQRGFWLLAAVPYVRILFASGSFALGNTDQDSDIDILVVLRGGRIWTGRFFVTVLIHFLSLRRHGKKIADRICLNHFITDMSLKIPFESLYNAHVYANLVPIMTVRGAKAEDFFKANEWINNFVSRDGSEIISKRTIAPNPFLLTIGSVLEFVLNTPLGETLEKVLKRLQQERILNNPATQSKKGHVLADDNMLAFHPHSPEKDILEKYTEQLKELNIES